MISILEFSKPIRFFSTRMVKRTNTAKTRLAIHGTTFHEKEHQESKKPREHRQNDDHVTLRLENAGSDRTPDHLSGFARNCGKLKSAQTLTAPELPHRWLIVSTDADRDFNQSPRHHPALAGTGPRAFDIPLNRSNIQTRRCTR